MTAEEMIKMLTKFLDNKHTAKYEVLVRLPDGQRVSVTHVAQDAFCGPVICVEMEDESLK